MKEKRKLIYLRCWPASFIQIKDFHFASAWARGPSIPLINQTKAASEVHSINFINSIAFISFVWLIHFIHFLVFCWFEFRVVCLFFLLVMRQLPSAITAACGHNQPPVQEKPNNPSIQSTSRAPLNQFILHWFISRLGQQRNKR